VVLFAYYWTASRLGGHALNSGIEYQPEGKDILRADTRVCPYISGLKISGCIIHLAFQDSLMLVLPVYHYWQLTSFSIT